MEGELEIKPLHLLAIKLAELNLTFDEIRKKYWEIGEYLEDEIKLRRERGNVINICVRGEQASGKSLVGFTLTKSIHEGLHMKKFSVKQIDADQIDFVQSMKDPTKGYECRLIDEWNEMSTTGFNASTNQALLTSINEVQAQRFVDKVSCSPEKILDPTARIILEVLDKDINTRSTKCLVYYVLYKDGMRIEQFCGATSVDVSKNLKDKTYLAYRRRKFEKMNMLLKYGILDSRAVDEAKIVLAVKDKMFHLVKECDILQRDVVDNYIDVVQKELVVLSIWGKEELIRKIMGIMSHLKNANKISMQIGKYEKIIKKEADPMMREFYTKRIEVLMKSMNDILINFAELIAKYERIVRVSEEYANLNETKIAKGEKESNIIKGEVVK